MYKSTALIAALAVTQTHALRIDSATEATADAELEWDWFNDVIEDIGDAVDDFGDWVEDAVEDVGDAFGDLGDWAENAWDDVGDAFDDLGDWAEDAWDDFVDWGEGAVEDVVDAFEDFGEGIVDIGEWIIDGSNWEALGKTLLGGAASALQGDFDKAGKLLGNSDHYSGDFWAEQ